MKNLFKKILILKLDFLAKLYLWRFKPEIIAITGNVGKTSTKEAVAVVLKKIKRVRSGRGNLNNEFGVPLSIIGDWGDEYYEKGGGLFFWLKVLFLSFIRFIFITGYPEILVLEYGADKPGDIGRLVRKYKPKVSIVTAVGDIPVHVEYFSDPDAVAKEKSKLISSLKTTDFAILNHDDPMVLDMKEKTKAKVMTFGFSEGSTIRISNFDYQLDDNANPEGVGFKINYGAHSFVPMVINGSLGKSQSFSAGAASCVGIIYGMNLIDIGNALADYRGPSGRLKLLNGIKNSIIIDDTYNAAPSSMHLALETMKDITALRQAKGKTTRKLVVLGDMLELGKYTIEAHQTAGTFAAGIADILVTVGLRGKMMAHAAENQLALENIHSFPTSDLAKQKVQELIKEWDLILVKGSQGARMEKIVEEIMADPQFKKDFLVRQGRKWLKK
jgi:UDP-N-acetylmuramoyl-tripeptide--D-alanyl-D-alanine ligase